MTDSAYEKGQTSVTTVEKFKIVFLGDQGTGKTSIITRFLFDSFRENYQATSGVDLMLKALPKSEKNIQFQLWDTSGQGRFISLLPSYIRSSALAVITFDVNDHNTFASVAKWIEDIKNESGAGAKILLVGTKTDLGSDKRQVSIEEADKFARENGIKYREVSSKDSIGIEDLFLTDIVDFLSEETAVSKSENKPQKTVESAPYADLVARIAKLTQDYPKNADVIAIAKKLQEGLLDDNPQEFFNRQFDENQDDNLLTNLKKLAWTSRSMLNTVVNVVIAVLQKVCALAHALAYCIGLVAQQRSAYPAFWVFGERQQAEKLCHDVLDTVGLTRV